MIPYLFGGAAALCGVAVLVCAARTARPVRTVLLSVLAGIAVLALLSLTGSFTGLRLPVNGWTVACAGAAGVPGVLLMVLVRMLWGIG